MESWPSGRSAGRGAGKLSEADPEKKIDLRKGSGDNWRLVSISDKDCDSGASYVSSPLPSAPTDFLAPTDSHCSQPLSNSHERNRIQIINRPKRWYRTGHHRSQEISTRLRYRSLPWTSGSWSKRSARLEASDFGGAYFDLNFIIALRREANIIKYITQEIKQMAMAKRRMAADDETVITAERRLWNKTPISKQHPIVWSTHNLERGELLFYSNCSHAHDFTMLASLLTVKTEVYIKATTPFKLPSFHQSWPRSAPLHTCSPLFHTYSPSPSGKNHHANKGKNKCTKKASTPAIASAHPTISFRCCTNPKRISGGLSAGIGIGPCSTRRATCSRRMYQSRAHIRNFAVWKITG